MKKALCILLMVCCVFAMFGCHRQEAAPENSVAVYYKKATADYGSAEGIIGKTYLDITGHEEDYTYLLDLYLLSELSDEFVSTFPAGTSVVRFRLEGLTAKIILNSQMANCTNMDLTVALTCLTKTIMSMTGCQEVIISASGTLLHGEKFITLNKDSFLLLDDSGLAAN